MIKQSSCVVLVIPAILNEGMQYLTLYQMNEDLSQQLTAHEYAAATEMKPTRVHIASISCVTKKYSIFPESNKGQ
jgi:hypothetical protein